MTLLSSKRKLFASAFALAIGLASSAQAQGISNFSCTNFVPSWRVTHNTGADSGLPGVIWLSMVNPDQSAEYDFTADGWVEYRGGLRQPAAIFQGGLPPSVTFQPPPLLNFEGWTIYTAQGVLTPEAQANVALRRQFLNEAKPERVANGTWRSDMDSDQQYIWSLVDKDARNNNKYWSAGQLVGRVACQAPMDLGN